ncbi:MAG: glycosyl hydrolase 53 family protein [Bacillota bacterium]
MKKMLISTLVTVLLLMGFDSTIYAQPAKSKSQEIESNNFRMALSLGQGVSDTLKQGYKFKYGNNIARTPKELQRLYRRIGSNEMFVRINTKRYNDGDVSIDPEHAELLSLESGLKVCKIAKELGLKVNPEIMVAYTYMDSFSQQAPNFKDYPEITQPNKPWSEYNLEEMKDVLYQYGKLVAKEVVKSGCEVEFWNIGNEANFGFGGVSVGLKTAVNPILENKTLQDMYTSPSFGAQWLKENVWNYNGEMMAALANGIKKVDPDAKFSTHITTAMADTNFMTSYFKTLAENGYNVDQVGISFYPTSMSHFTDPVNYTKNMITETYNELKLPIFVAEYAYPSEAITSGPFADWDTPIPGYEISEKDQARFTIDFIKWGRENGVSGIRPWAPDLSIINHWAPMSLFKMDSDGSTLSAKPILYELKKYLKNS